MAKFRASYSLLSGRGDKSSLLGKREAESQARIMNFIKG
jgi:hypothetical protein